VKSDYRNPEAIEHSVEELVAQWEYGLCLGYEDLNDHDELRADPLLTVMVGKTNPKGELEVKLGIAARRWQARAHGIEWN
jgi:hypothetical protein